MSAKDHFKALREECVWLRVCYNTFNSLYDSAVNREVLERTAALFFGDLNRILQEYHLLQACKISDLARTGRHDNLTVKAMNDQLKAEGLLSAEIEELSANIHRYREIIKPARDRLIAHLDADTVLEGADLSDHTRSELEEFHEAVQAYCDAVGRAVGEGPLDFSFSAGKGDVIDLLRVLRRSVSAAPG